MENMNKVISEVARISLNINTYDLSYKYLYFLFKKATFPEGLFFQVR